MRLLVIIFILFSLVTLSSRDVRAASWQDGLTKTATEAHIDTAPASPDIVVARVISQVLSFVGVLFMGFMIWAGFLWMTAGGNEDKIEEAKKILLSAIIGLIIIAAAYAITQFIGQSLMKAPPST